MPLDLLSLNVKLKVTAAKDNKSQTKYFLSKRMSLQMFISYFKIRTQLASAFKKRILLVTTTVAEWCAMNQNIRSDRFMKMCCF